MNPFPDSDDDDFQPPLHLPPDVPPPHAPPLVPSTSEKKIPILPPKSRKVQNSVILKKTNLNGPPLLSSLSLTEFNEEVNSENIQTLQENISQTLAEENPSDPDATPENKNDAQSNSSVATKKAPPSLPTKPKPSGSFVQALRKKPVQLVERPSLEKESMEIHLGEQIDENIPIQQIAENISPEQLIEENPHQNFEEEELEESSSWSDTSESEESFHEQQAVRSQYPKGRTTTLTNENRADLFEKTEFLKPTSTGATLKSQKSAVFNTSAIRRGNAKKMNAIKEGFLEKQGHVVLNWKKRWFVLTATGMEYYTKPSSVKPKGLIDFTQGFLKVEEYVDKVEKRKYCLKLYLKEKDFIVDCKNNIELQGWIKAINEIAQYYL